jgi:hypothetical protein
MFLFACSDCKLPNFLTSTKIQQGRSDPGMVVSFVGSKGSVGIGIGIEIEQMTCLICSGLSHGTFDPTICKLRRNNPMETSARLTSKASRDNIALFSKQLLIWTCKRRYT